MTEYETDPKKILASSSADFQQLHKEIGQAVKGAFPKTHLQAAWGMAAWVAPIADPPAKEDWKGTMPHDVLTVAPTEKAAGITTHVWHPKHPSLLKENEAWLKDAGFKVMVGCLQWNKKAEFPVEAIQRLLQGLR